MKFGEIIYIKYVIKICSLTLVKKTSYVIAKMSKKKFLSPSFETHLFINH